MISLQEQPRISSTTQNSDHTHIYDKKSKLKKLYQKIKKKIGQKK
jgi:hypothetical protein